MSITEKIEKAKEEYNQWVLDREKIRKEGGYFSRLERDNKIFELIAKVFRELSLDESIELGVLKVLHTEIGEVVERIKILEKRFSIPSTPATGKISIGEEIFIPVKVLKVREDDNILVEIKTPCMDNVTTVVSRDRIYRSIKV